GKLQARMRPKIFWLDLQQAGRLAIMPRPRAGDWLVDVGKPKVARTNRSVAIHCRAGIGRSSMIAACVLVRNGRAVECAFAGHCKGARRRGARHGDRARVGLDIPREDAMKGPSAGNGAFGQGHAPATLADGAYRVADLTVAREQLTFSARSLDG